MHSSKYLPTISGKFDVSSPLIPESEDDLPEVMKREKAVEPAEQRVYFAHDIQRCLGLGRSKTYEFLDEVYRQKAPFRVIKVGKLFRIPKKSFDDWLNAEN